ncbi:hypothetical protein ACEPAF_9809 [Sanghuangporus sanghuang]
MDSPKTPRKKRTHRAVVTSPYFKQRNSKHQVKLELDHPISPSKAGFSKLPDFMTFHLNLPMGPDIDMDKPCEESLTEDDVRWYEEDFAKLQNPLYAFELRKAVYLRYKLERAKPILIQEELADDPWKLLIAVMLLNKTTGRTSIPVFWRILELWPSAKALSVANETELRALIQPLGLQDVRAKRLIKLSSCYLSEPPSPDKLHRSRAELVYVQVHPGSQRAKAIVKTPYPPTPISHLPGAGAYALDSYRIFCAPDDEWKRVLPTDKELIRYLKWKWAYFENRRWEPDRGVVGPLDEDYLEALPSLIAP